MLQLSVMEKKHLTVVVEPRHINSGVFWVKHFPEYLDKIGLFNRISEPESTDVAEISTATGTNKFKPKLCKRLPIRLGTSPLNYFSKKVTESLIMVKKKYHEKKITGISTTEQMGSIVYS